MEWVVFPQFVFIGAFDSDISANDDWAVDPFYADKIIAIIEDNKTYNDYKF